MQQQLPQLRGSPHDHHLADYVMSFYIVGSACTHPSTSEIALSRGLLPPSHINLPGVLGNSQIRVVS